MMHIQSNKVQQRWLILGHKKIGIIQKQKYVTFIIIKIQEF